MLGSRLRVETVRSRRVVDGDLRSVRGRETNLEPVREQVLTIGKEVTGRGWFIKTPISYYVSVSHCVSFRLVVAASIRWTDEPIGLFKKVGQMRFWYLRRIASTSPR